MEDALLPNLTPSMMRGVAAPKVVGTHHMLSMAQMLPTMQINLFSSTSALVCPIGQSNYASANAQLNAVATLHNAKGEIILCHLLAHTMFLYFNIDLGMLQFAIYFRNSKQSPLGWCACKRWNETETILSSRVPLKQHHVGSLGDRHGRRKQYPGAS